MDKKKPDRYEVIGSLTAILGAIIIFYAHEDSHAFQSVISSSLGLWQLFIFMIRLFSSKLAHPAEFRRCGLRTDFQDIIAGVVIVNQRLVARYPA